MNQELRTKIRTAISNSYYDARNSGQTMETAADNAADAVMHMLRPSAGDDVVAWIEAHLLEHPLGSRQRKLLDDLLSDYLACALSGATLRDYMERGVMQ